ncbi:MAG: peptidase T [Defluviitaleaceae bacterium]|nr:peptidase T [Defluviitaleaceae bacterium]
MTTVKDRFLELILHDTQSDENSDTYPSTESQLAFGEILAEKCRKIGLTEVNIDRYGYVTATLPANTEKSTKIIGFLAHMDTSPDAPGSPVKARVIANYDGKDIPLNKKLTLSPTEFPDLTKYIGQDLIVTDGNTLLGTDDKAGIAEILTAMEFLIANPQILHEKIRIAFTPDEEIGKGVDFFDIPFFGADYAYTVDGGEIGELESETFNASSLVFKITGKSVHPGTAKGVMVNAALVATEIINSFPPTETPAHTEGYEGFYHLSNITAEVGKAHLVYILRDHDSTKLKEKEQTAIKIAEKINKKYGYTAVQCEIKSQYRNMHEIIKNHMHIMDRAKLAMQAANVVPIIKPIRGGTDGARLSFMGLPCPNIFAGGHNAHGPFEYIPVQSMEAAVRVIVNICKINC